MLESNRRQHSLDIDYKIAMICRNLLSLATLFIQTKKNYFDENVDLFRHAESIPNGKSPNDINWWIVRSKNI